MESLLQTEVSLEKLVETLRAPTEAVPVESPETRRMLQLCRYAGKTVKSLAECSALDSIPADSLGFGTVSEVAQLIGRFAIPVLMQPSEAERTLLRRSGYEVRRLLWLFQFDPSSLYFFCESDQQSGKGGVLRGESRGTGHDAVRRRVLPAATRAPRAHDAGDRGERLVRRRGDPRGYQDGDDAGRVLGAVHNRGDGAELAGRREDRDDERSVCGGTDQLGVRRHTRGRGEDRHDRLSGRHPRDCRGDPQVPVPQRGAGPRDGRHQVGANRGDEPQRGRADERRHLRVSAEGADAALHAGDP